MVDKKLNNRFRKTIYIITYDSKNKNKNIDKFKIEIENIFKYIQDFIIIKDRNCNYEQNIKDIKIDATIHEFKLYFMIEIRHNTIIKINLKKIKNKLDLLFEYKKSKITHEIFYKITKLIEYINKK